MTILTSKDDDRSPKEALPLLSVIGQMSSQLERGSQQITQVMDWTRKVCAEQPVGKWHRPLRSLLEFVTLHPIPDFAST